LRAEQLRWKRREEEEEEEEEEEDEEVERWNEDGLKKGEKSAQERGKVKSEKSRQLKKWIPTFIDLPQGKVLSTSMSLDEKKTLVLSFKEKEATWEFLVLLFF
jgi:hypothetical protein